MATQTMAENMKYTFELNTTVNKPVYLSLDGNSTLKQLYEEILLMVECNTSLLRDDVIDVFVQNKTTTLSLPQTFGSVDEFLYTNPEYFNTWYGSLHNNIHSLYVMDRVYLETHLA